jgi:hypothetical protein
MKLKIFCRCSLLPTWSGSGLISTPVQLLFKILHYECVEEHLVVHHTLMRLGFEFGLKILVLLSCYVIVINRSFSFIMKTTSL